MPRNPHSTIDPATWIDAREAAALLGRNRDALTREARRTWQPKGLARLAKGPKGGVARWWLSRSIDDRLAFGPGRVELASKVVQAGNDRDSIGVLGAIDRAAFALGSMLDTLRVIHVPRTCEAALKRKPATMRSDARRMIGELHGLRAGVLDHLIGNVKPDEGE